MSPAETGLWGTVLLLFLLFIFRMPVGFAMAIVGFAGFGLMTSLKAACGMLGTEIWTVFSSYGLTVIPLFIFMGQICFHCGVNQRLYKTAYVWTGHIRGGLAMSTILACAGFSAISGSNTATAATMSAVALPEMKKYHYNPLLSTGVIAVGATLGVVIPPSVVLIIIGLQTQQDIARLFWASIPAGVLLTGLFLLTTWFVCLCRPDWAQAGPQSTWSEKIAALPGSVEVLILFGLVMGGLFLGLFTPSEAGAAGAALACALTLVTRQLTWKRFTGALISTLHTASMIFMIITGAVIFGRFLTITRLPFELSSYITDLALAPVTVLCIICLVYIIGGAIMDALALLLITIPVFFPLVESLGYDPLWFAVVVTLVTTLGAVTPPVGITAFVVSGMAEDVPVQDIFRGISYFLGAYIVCIALLMLFPQIVLFLPALMGY